MDDTNRLLKELSHRVGNNLAIIMGVLRSEIRKAPPEHQEALEATLQRVFELAAEHEERLRRASKVFDPATTKAAEADLVKLASDGPLIEVIGHRPRPPLAR